jgi:small subunit ribosomal protein S3e
MRQGVLGVKVKIMQDWDPTGKNGPKKPLPDLVTILEPKEDEPIPVVQAPAPVAQPQE